MDRTSIGLLAPCIPAVHDELLLAAPTAVGSAPIRPPAACTDALPDELLLTILAYAYPPVRNSDDCARRDPATFDAEVEHCAALARISALSKRWCRLCDATSDLYLIYGEEPVPVRRRTSRVDKVIVHVKRRQKTDVDWPGWLPELVGPTATVVLCTEVEDLFPMHAPAWAAVDRCGFDEIVLAPARRPLDFGVVLPFDLTGLRRLRLGEQPCSVHAESCRPTLTTFQVTLSGPGGIFLRDICGWERRSASQLRSLHVLHAGTPPDLFLEHTIDWTFAANLEALTWEAHNPPAFAALWTRSRNLTTVTLGRDALNDTLLAHLPTLRNLAYLRLVYVPAHDGAPSDWTFDILAEQVALLLAQREPERGAARLCIEIVVDGPLSKYDLAQRSAKASFQAATTGLTAAQTDGIEVLLLFHPRPYRIFPRETLGNDAS